VTGDVITFYVWTGTDQPAKTTYRGTMSAAGKPHNFRVANNPLETIAQH
jgi:hypothetical protein